MFKNFIKGVTSDKDEKDKRKRDKKDRKEKTKRTDRGSMSAEELLRLDEMRRSLKIRGKRKDKEKLPSGITADYTADFLASLERKESSMSPISARPMSPSQNNHFIECGYTQSDSSETSLNSINQKNVPPLPPKPPKRGILKARGNSLPRNNGYQELNNSDHSNLQRNTLQNELLSYQTREVVSYQNLTNLHSENGVQNKDVTSQLLVITSTSPSGDSLTDTTNSSFATPPFSLSPVGESQGFHRWSRTSNFDDYTLPLPEIAPMSLPEPRILVIQRQKPPRNDFGFSLRRAMVLERSTDKSTRNASAAGGASTLNGGSVLVNGFLGVTSIVGVTNGANLGPINMRAVIFAEPGAMVQHNNETGLLPGDKLLEVNGVCVEEKSREEIIDMIKASGDSVTLKVQPVAELSELSRRSTHDGREVVLDETYIRGGTLKRSGSRRFYKNTTVSKFKKIYLLP